MPKVAFQIRVTGTQSHVEKQHKFIVNTYENMQCIVLERKPRPSTRSKYPDSWLSYIEVIPNDK